MSEAKFIKGLFVKAPRQGAPDFVKGSISIKTVDLMRELQGSNEDWINLDIKESRDGKWYCQINDWKPETKPNDYPASQPKDFEDDMPF